MNRLFKAVFGPLLRMLFPPQSYAHVPQQQVAQDPLQPRSLSITTDLPSKSISPEPGRGHVRLLPDDSALAKGEPMIPIGQYQRLASTEVPTRWTDPSGLPTEETPA